MAAGSCIVSDKIYDELLAKNREFLYTVFQLASRSPLVFCGLPQIRHHQTYSWVIVGNQVFSYYAYRALKTKRVALGLRTVLPAEGHRE